MFYVGRYERKKQNRVSLILGLLLLLTAVSIALACFCDTSPEGQLRSFAFRNGLHINDWPEELIELMKRNPDTMGFVLNYPLKKDEASPVGLSEYTDSTEVPLLMQWDKRWGYRQYAGDMFVFSGCGPTCLSMVCIYLLGETGFTPAYIADFAEDEGYGVPGNGSAWTLISEGGKQLGLDVTEIPLDENRIIRNLEAGNPIICVMGPGDFTTTGHFIVMTDYADGKVKVNDPNSLQRSQQLWDLGQIKDQIRNLWVCRSPG